VDWKWQKMNIKKAALFVLVLVMISVSCNLFTPTSNNADVAPDGLNQLFDNLPPYDPAGPLPSPGAAALDALTELDPSVAVLKDDVQASEREALNALLADLQIQLGAETGTGVPFLLPRSGSAKIASPAAAVSFPTDYNPQGDGNFLFEATFAAILTSQVSDQLAVTPGAGEDKSANGADGSATTNSGVKFKKNPDGSTSLEIADKTDASKGDVAAKTDSKVSIDGWRCPNDAGQVSFTIKEHFNSGSAGASYTADLTAYVRAEVNDNGELASTTIDVNQGTRKVKDGRNVYVESSATNKNGTKSNQQVVRSSQEASAGDVSNLSAAGEDAAYIMALGSLLFAQSNWEKGGCVKIDANSPGKVDPGSTTSIPVKVVSRIDGSAVSSKLVAALSGGASIDPTLLAKTPGTLTYTAPNEAGKSATILLTATSKRGKAKLELTANTGEKKQSYQVIETPGIGRSWVGDCIDDLAKPFSLSFTAPEQTLSFSFSPASSTSGSLIEKIHFALGGTTMDYTGSGNYEVIPSDKDAEGNVIGMEIAYHTSGSAKSCAEGKCVTNKMDMGKGLGIPLRVQDGACP
jgi:hypothetical protein